MRVLLMHNPTAGDDGVDADEVAAPLRAAGHVVEAESVKSDGWKEALSRDVDVVVVAGGDGAVAKVFKQLAGRGKIAALLPVGSANNIAKSLGYGDDESPERLIRLLEEGERSRFDIGRLSWPAEAEPFVESAGAGVFAEMLVHAEEIDSDAGGPAKIELGLRLLREVVHDVPARGCGVEADGVDLSGEFIAVEAMNVGLLGPNVPLAPGADPGDGKLELALVREDDRGELAAYAEARLEHRPPPPLELDVRCAEVIELRPPAGWPLHFDDELVEGSASRLSAAINSGLVVLRPRP